MNRVCLGASSFFFRVISLLESYSRHLRTDFQVYKMIFSLDDNERGKWCMFIVQKSCPSSDELKPIASESDASSDT